jgi:hypothetical protein
MREVRDSFGVPVRRAQRPLGEGREERRREEGGGVRMEEGGGRRSQRMSHVSTSASTSAHTPSLVRSHPRSLSLAEAQFRAAKPRPASCTRTRTRTKTPCTHACCRTRLPSSRGDMSKTQRRAISAAISWFACQIMPPTPPLSGHPASSTSLPAPDGTTDKGAEGAARVGCETGATFLKSWSSSILASNGSMSLSF